MEPYFFVEFFISTNFGLTNLFSRLSNFCYAQNTIKLFFEEEVIMCFFYKKKGFNVFRVCPKILSSWKWAIKPETSRNKKINRKRKVSSNEPTSQKKSKIMFPKFYNCLCCFFRSRSYFLMSCLIVFKNSLVLIMRDKAYIWVLFMLGFQF